jgi:hypothetical protein
MQMIGSRGEGGARANTNASAPSIREEYSEARSAVIDSEPEHGSYGGGDDIPF